MSDLTEVTEADEEPAEAPQPSGARAALRRRLGYHPQCLHHEEGILLRLG